MANLGPCLICEEGGKSAMASVVIDAVPMCRSCARTSSASMSSRFPVISEQDRGLRFVPAPATVTFRPEPQVLELMAPKGVLEEIPASEPHRTLSRHSLIVKSVCEEAAAYYSMSVHDLTNKCRGRDYVSLRQVVIWIFRHYAPMGFAEMGRMLQQHHTSVIHTARTADERYARDESFVFAVASVWQRAMLRRRDPQTHHRQDSLITWAESQVLQRRNIHSTVSELKVLWQTVGAA